MKRLLFVILACQGYFSISAQEFYVGLSGGLESHGSVSLITNTFGIEAHEKINAKALNPVIRTDIPINAKWQVMVSAKFRKNTLSVSAWDPRADTCIFCPVIKGGGPTAFEFRVSPEIGRILNWRKHRFIVSGGLTWAIRTNIQSNSISNDSHGMLMRQFSTVFEKNITYITLGISWLWKRVLTDVRFEKSGNYGRMVRLYSQAYPFHLNENRITLMIGFKVFQL